MSPISGGRKDSVVDTPNLIDVNAGSQLTGLDRATLYGLARQGCIRSFKVLGTALRFDRIDLLKLIEERPASQQDPRSAASPATRHTTSAHCGAKEKCDGQ